VLRFGGNEKTLANLQHMYKSQELFAYNNQDFDFKGYKPYFNGFLTLKSWSFASMLAQVGNK
jgi:hypothetical protein